MWSGAPIENRKSPGLLRVPFGRMMLSNRASINAPLLGWTEGVSLNRDDPEMETLQTLTRREK